MWHLWILCKTFIRFENNELQRHLFRVRTAKPFKAQTHITNLILNKDDFKWTSLEKNQFFLYRPNQFGDRCPSPSNFQGLVDVEKEVTKLMAKQGDLEKQMEKLREKMAKSDYKEKVPVKVQEQDAEKVRKRNWLSGFL